MSNIVVFGAGQTGRGYINRYAQISGDKTVFVDRDDELVNALNEQGSYQISFASQRGELTVDNFRAISLGDRALEAVLDDADVVFTSVGATHVSEVGETLRHWRNTGNRKLSVITAENGVGVSDSISYLRARRDIALCESIVFCTTLGRPLSLDIMSEDLDYFPYDEPMLAYHVPLDWMHADGNIESLMRRKIYTYNCISAAISYLGYYQGYRVYAEAANDTKIGNVIDGMLPPLNAAVSRKFEISLSEQEEFSQRALLKFKNRRIVDTVERNCRNVLHKLSADERIVAPLALIYDSGLECDGLLLTAAAALLYGKSEEQMMDGSQIHLCGLPQEWSDRVASYYGKLERGRPLEKVLED